MANASLYPPSPSQTPQHPTAPSSQYLARAALVLIGLALFFTSYFGMMFACVLFVAWAILWCPFDGEPWCYVTVAAILATPFVLVPFLFLSKNLFRVRPRKKQEVIEVFPPEHPALFDFIQQTCDEIGTARPVHVYVDHRVNAHVRWETSSLLHLFLPTRRNLVIGLGLVNGINLTEFKAILAHEFGHFAQKSSRLGYFVSKALQICHHNIHGEDFFDRALIAWANLHPLLAWPAYLHHAVLACMGKIVEMLGWNLIILHLALKRQMEYNADLMAVRLTGSDALPRLLHRGHLGQTSLHQALDDLEVAMESGLYTTDLFLHQSAAMKRLGPASASEGRGGADDAIASLWQGHPSDFNRVRNVKRHGVRTEFDERSAWLLFGNAEELRRQISVQACRFYFKIPEEAILVDAIKVQGFIDAEHADRCYDPRYQGLYDNRDLMLTDLPELARTAAAHPCSVLALAEAHRAFYAAEVKLRAERYVNRCAERDGLLAVVDGWRRPKDGSMEFRGEVYPASDAKRLLQEVEREIECDVAWLADLDRRVFMTYFQMALSVDAQIADELHRRYEFHLRLQAFARELQNQNGPLQAAVATMNVCTSEHIDADASPGVLASFQDTHQTLAEILLAADSMILPPLKNLPAGQPLRPFLLKQSLVACDLTNTNRWTICLLEQFNEMRSKIFRIRVKSLAGILALQEGIAIEFSHSANGLPAVANDSHCHTSPTC